MLFACVQCLLDKLVRMGGVNSETLPVVMGGVLQVSHTLKLISLASPKPPSTQQLLFRRMAPC
jgi:hypothetical protein